jgi:hypothetical protein
MVTENVYQSMFLVYETGVVVVDAPPTFAAHLRHAIDEVTKKPITHVIYSPLTHRPHRRPGGLGGNPIIIAHEETKNLLARANDPARPLPTVTFSDRYTLKVGSQVLELSYHGMPMSREHLHLCTRSANVDGCGRHFPRWMPWRRFAVAQDVGGYFAQVEEIRKFDFDTLVSGHVARTGRRPTSSCSWIS